MHFLKFATKCAFNLGGRFDAYDLSRLGRDYIEAGRYVKKIFPSLNVRFVSILDRFDSLTATVSDVNLLIPIKTFVNDNFSRDISTKVKSTQEVLRSNGLYIGSYVAYGYKKMDEDKNHIEPDEYAADVVRRIFNMKLEGYSAGRIADKLNSIGILAPGEYKKTLGINYKTGWQTKVQIKWSAMAIYRILSNKIYIGVLEQGKRRKVSYKITKIVEKSEHEWNVVENNHEAIITKTDFDNIQRMLKTDTRIAPTEKKVYTFSGMIYCGDCGKSMIRRVNRNKGVDKVYYICNTYNCGKGCSRHSIDEKNLSEIVLSAINTHIESLVRMKELLAEIDSTEIEYSDIFANDTELNQRYEELEKCRKMELSLHRDVANHVISKEEYTQFKGINEEKCKDLQSSIDKIRTEIENVLKTGLSSNDWIEQLKKYKNLISLNRVALVSLVEKVIVYEHSRVEIIFRYKDEYESLCRLFMDLHTDHSLREEECIHG